MRNGFNGTMKIIDIAGSGGAFLGILATGPVRYVKITESLLTATGGANVVQGFNYEVPNDTTANGFTQVFNIPPGEVLELGDPMSLYGSHGTMIGNGPSVIIGIGATAATTLCYLRSATATGTSVVVEQIY